MSFGFYAKADSSDYIRIVGSVSLYPKVSRICEDFAVQNNTKLPLIEATGTGAGFNVFCMGSSNTSPDIVMATRKIKPSEVKLCEQNNIKNIEEMLIGTDSLVLITKNNSAFFNFSKQELADVLSGKESKINGKFIKFYGPGSNSTNYETIVHVILENKSQIRQDSHYIQNGNNNNIIIAKTLENQDSIGIVPIEYYLSHQSEVRPVLIDNLEPNDENYPLRRELYLYINNNKPLKYINKLTRFIDRHIN